MAHEQMLKTHPDDLVGIDQDKLAECIAPCFDCAQVCTACADACLAEDMVADLRTCIRTNLDCADICGTTGRAISRQTGRNVEVLRTFLKARRDARALQGLCPSLPPMREGLP
jgi:hypothetical protein